MWNVTPAHREASCLSRGVAAACRGGLRHHWRRVCGGGGVGWLGPLRAPGGKTVSAAATVQLQYMHSSVRGAVWELANCRRVDLRALTAGQPNVCIRLHFSPRSRVTTDQVLVAIWGPSNICIRPQIPVFFIFLGTAKQTSHFADTPEEAHYHNNMVRK